MSGRVRDITLRVACAQLEAVPVFRAREALAQILRAVAQAGRAKAGLLVLPECSYPGYVLLDANPYRASIPSDGQALAAISRAARRARCAVAVGIARRRSSALFNEAVLIDKDGVEIGGYDKTRLWNFDQHWFRSGRALPVFDTAFGRVGMLICADGRNPEIARTLVAKGAWLLLNPTAWVGTGASHDRIRNVQADYMLRVRALENGCWIAAASKCGSELGAVHYAGASQIVDPEGVIVARASQSHPELIVADVRRRASKPFVAVLSAADRKALRAQPPRNGAPHRVPPRVWIGVYQSGRSRRDDPKALKALAVQQPLVIVRTGASAPAIAAALRKMPGLRLHVISGRAMVAVEPVRAAALRGVDLIAWASPPAGLPLLDIARTRAVENRVYVLICSRSTADDPACLVHPDGSVVASALQGTPSGFVAAIDVIAARRKEIVPLTQTFADRLPEAYRWLDGSKRVAVS